jgi:hypothetical protein
MQSECAIWRLVRAESGIRVRDHVCDELMFLTKYRFLILLPGVLVGLLLLLGRPRFNLRALTFRLLRQNLIECAVEFAGHFILLVCPIGFAQNARASESKK